MNWPNIIIPIVAVYGAILSTYNIIVQLKKAAFRVKVEISMGLTTSGFGVSGPTIFLSVANIGERAITLSSEGFVLPDNSHLVFPNPLTNVTFPYDLLPGKNCQIWVEARILARELQSHGFSGKINLIGFYGTQIGKDFKSKPYKFDISKWIKSL